MLRTDDRSAVSTKAVGLSKRRALLIIGGLIAMCWALIAAAAFVDGGPLLQAVGGHSHHLAGELTTGDISLTYGLVLTALSWVVMTFAMMVPSSIPMINVILGATRNSDRRTPIVWAFFAGYLLVWTAFGIAAFAVSMVLNVAASHYSWLGNNWNVVIAIALAIGAIWQLTPLKDACLKECRNPLSFVIRYFQPGPRGGLRLGLRHGVFCVGCCWALMLVMVVAGSAQLFLMAALAVIMTVEKVTRWGLRIVKPIGFAFAAAAAVMLFVPVSIHAHEMPSTPVPAGEQPQPTHTHHH